MNKKRATDIYITHDISKIYKAIKAGCDEIPIGDNKTKDCSDAIHYAIDNTYTNVDLFNAIQKLPSIKQKNGEGRAVDKVAKEFGLSHSTIYQFKHIIKHSSEEAVKKIINGISTIKEEYKKCNPKNVTKNINENNSILGLLGNIISLLILLNQEVAAKIIYINFIEEYERSFFLNFIDDDIKNIIDKWVFSIE
jgi:hypothetical protein